MFLPALAQLGEAPGQARFRCEFNLQPELKHSTGPSVLPCLEFLRCLFLQSGTNSACLAGRGSGVLGLGSSRERSHGPIPAGQALLPPQPLGTAQVPGAGTGSMQGPARGQEERLNSNLY